MKYFDIINKSKELNNEISGIKKNITKLTNDSKKKKNRNKKDEILAEIINYNDILEKKENELTNFSADLINMIEFNVDSDFKKEYLQQKPFATAKSDLLTFVSLDEFEEMIGKSVYNFSFDDRDALLMMKYKNTTPAVVNSTVSKIKGYIDFCTRKKDEKGISIVEHMQNVFDTLPKSEALKFVSKQATEFRYISEKQKREYQDKLVNFQDKLILELPYIGVRGRTKRGGTLEEIINLEIDPKSEDFKNNMLTLSRNDGTERDFEISDYTKDLIIKTYDSKLYFANNDVESKSLKINRFNNNVLCAVGNTKLGTLNPVTINARLQLIQKYCENQFITINNLYMSGMITKAINIYKKNGELIDEDYIQICKDFKYGSNPKQYFSKLKGEIELYLKGALEDA